MFWASLWPPCCVQHPDILAVAGTACPLVHMGPPEPEGTWNPVPVPLSTTNTEHVLPPNPSGLFVHGESRACLPGRERETREASGPSRLGSSATPGSSAAAFVGGESRAHQLSRHRPQGSRWAVPGTGRRAPVCAPTCAGAAQVGGHRPAPSPPPLQGLGSHADVRLHPEPRAGVRRGQLLGRRTRRGPGPGRRRASPGEAWFPGRTEARSLSCAPLPGPSRRPPPRRPPSGAPFVGGAAHAGTGRPARRNPATGSELAGPALSSGPRPGLGSSGRWSHLGARRLGRH